MKIKKMVFTFFVEKHDVEDGQAEILDGFLNADTPMYQKDNGPVVTDATDAEIEGAVRNWFESCE